MYHVTACANEMLDEVVHAEGSEVIQEVQMKVQQEKEVDERQ